MSRIEPPDVPVPPPANFARPLAPGSPLGDDQVAVELQAYQLGLAAGVGRVVDAGARAEGLRDRQVLVGPLDPCGECDVCRRGGVAVCPQARRRTAIGGAAGNRVIAAGRWVVPLDDGLELPVPDAAAVAGDVALAYTLYARTGVAPRDPVVVVGNSPIARFLVQILAAKDIAAQAVAAAPGDDLAQTRAALGAAFALQSLGTKPWRVICGDPAVTAVAAALAGPRATLMLLVGDMPALTPDVLAREVTILSVAAAHPDLMVEAAAMCVRGEVDLASGITTGDDPLRTRVRAVRA